ncbi:MAG: hypothetical protein U0804_27680 [Gemmataceae bacterium]
MPHGLRGRVALFGAGLLGCAGIVGCTGDHAGKAPPVSKAKAGNVTPPGARTTVPDISRPTGGSGLSNGPSYQPGTTPQGGVPTPGYTGGINAPVTPGNYGPGAPLPGGPVVPQLTPSNYTPTTPPAAPTTARGAAPSAPPVSTLAEVPLQPPAPPGALSPAVTVPAAAQVPGPIAPEAPFPLTR